MIYSYSSRFIVQLEQVNNLYIKYSINDFEDNKVIKGEYDLSRNNLDLDTLKEVINHQLNIKLKTSNIR